MGASGDVCSLRRMGTSGDPWGPVGIYGDQWGHLGTPRNPWGSMGTYGGLGEPIRTC